MREGCACLYFFKYRHFAGITINQGLFALGQVFTSLSQHQAKVDNAVLSHREPPKEIFVNYRDSALTRVLAGSVPILV